MEKKSTERSWPTEPPTGPLHFHRHRHFHRNFNISGPFKAYQMHSSVSNEVRKY